MRNETGNLIERSARLQIVDLDFQAFVDQLLDSASLRCLRYMHDIEGHTMCYLRDLLVTRAHRDPESSYAQHARNEGGTETRSHGYSRRTESLPGATA